MSVTINDIETKRVEEYWMTSGEGWMIPELLRTIADRLEEHEARLDKIHVHRLKPIGGNRYIGDNYRLDVYVTKNEDC